MKIMLATRNAHKIEEIKHKLQIFPELELMSLDSFPDLMDVEETGTSFEENACLKAQYYAQHTGMLCLADDSGLEIDALNKQPGVHSARYLGYDTSYQVKNAHIIGIMKDQVNRSARYVAVIALAYPNKDCVHFKGVIEGMIATKSLGQGGFGYDAIFVPIGQDLSFAQMSMKQKNALSHRGRALEACVNYLERILSNA
jgi:XTP/dITP diphosphohydrolase